MSERQPPGSIIERFRGTPWESPPPEALPPPPRRGPSVGIVLAAIVVLGGLVSVIALASRPPEPDDSTFLRPPDVTPRVPDSIRILDRFWATVRDALVSYHLEGTGTSSAPNFKESFELSLDVVGDDYVGTVNTIGGSGQAELIRLDGVMFARPAGADWIVARTSDARLRQEPFMGIAGKRELEYGGRFVEDGAVVHRLASTRFYGPSVARMLDLASFGLHADTLTLEVIVSDEGEPRRATFTCIVSGRAVDGVPDFEGTAGYTFSAFGEAVVIATPAP
jgi:hypothetical protein